MTTNFCHFESDQKWWWKMLSTIWTREIAQINVKIQTIVVIMIFINIVCWLDVVQKHLIFMIIDFCDSWNARHFKSWSFFWFFEIAYESLNKSKHFSQSRFETKFNLSNRHEKQTVEQISATFWKSLQKSTNSSVNNCFLLKNLSY